VVANEKRKGLLPRCWSWRNHGLTKQIIKVYMAYIKLVPTMTKYRETKVECKKNVLWGLSLFFDWIEIKAKGFIT